MVNMLNMHNIQDTYLHVTNQGTQLMLKDMWNMLNMHMLSMQNMQEYGGEISKCIICKICK
jgi:hypothetical protein